jgi:hypothetical protein
MDSSKRSDEQQAELVEEILGQVCRYCRRADTRMLEGIDGRLECWGSDLAECRRLEKARFAPGHVTVRKVLI